MFADRVLNLSKATKHDILLSGFCAIMGKDEQGGGMI